MNKDCNNCKYQDEMIPYTCDIYTSLDEDDYCMWKWNEKKIIKKFQY